MKMIRSALKSLTHNPIKSTLTLITVGLGVAVLILAISVSTYLSQILSRELRQEGIVVTFSNSEFNSDGNLERVMPPQLDENVIDIVRTEVDGVEAIAPTTGTFWNELKVGDRTYRIRTVAGTTEEYAQVMDFEAVAGSFFTNEDVEKGNRSVIISESLAELLFGSPSAAVGKILQPPSRQFGRGEDRAPVIQNYTVVGQDLP